MLIKRLKCHFFNNYKSDGLKNSGVPTEITSLT